MRTRTKAKKLTDTEVMHIARLAHLVLSPQEVKQFANQLSTILSYFQLLDSLQTHKTNPTAQVTGLVNVYRKDEHSSSLPVKKALSGATNPHQGYFRVPAIFQK